MGIEHARALESIYPLHDMAYLVFLRYSHFLFNLCNLLRRSAAATQHAQARKSAWRIRGAPSRRHTLSNPPSPRYTACSRGWRRWCSHCLQCQQGSESCPQHPPLFAEEENSFFCMRNGLQWFSLRRRYCPLPPPPPHRLRSRLFC